MGNLFDTTNAATTEPVEIIAGDYIAWKRTDLGTDYPPASYTLSYTARSEGTPARKISITASADGADYLVELSSATTLEYTAANYHWTAYITRNSDSARITIDTGIWTVRPDKATSADDPRTFARKMIALIETALLNRASNEQLDVLAYDLGIDASATRDPAKLLEHRTYWQRELVKENRKIAARKGSGGSKIGVRF
jgi:hypothetical protein